MQLCKSILAGAVSLAITSVTGANEVVPGHQLNNPWWTAGQATVDNKPLVRGRKYAKNVILFVGDGMGVSTVTAARILEGQLEGKLGESRFRSFKGWTSLPQQFFTSHLTQA